MPKGLREKAKKARKKIENVVNSGALHAVEGSFVVRDRISSLSKGKEKIDDRSPLEQLEDLASHAIGYLIREEEKQKKAQNLLAEIDVDTFKGYLEEECRGSKSYKKICHVLLRVAVMAGDDDKLSLILNTEGFTPDQSYLSDMINLAIIHDQVHITPTLLSTGVYVKSGAKKSALVLACEKGAYDTAHLLMDHGAIDSKAGSRFGGTLEQLCSLYSETSSTKDELIQRLLQEGALFGVSGRKLIKVITYIERSETLAWEGAVLLDQLVSTSQEGHVTLIAAWNIAEVLEKSAKAAVATAGDEELELYNEQLQKTANALRIGVRRTIETTPYSKLPPVLQIEKAKMHDLSSGAALVIGRSETMHLPYEIGNMVAGFLNEEDKASVRAVSRPVPTYADTEAQERYTARFRSPHKPKSQMELRKNYYAEAIMNAREESEDCNKIGYSL